MDLASFTNFANGRFLLSPVEQAVSAAIEFIRQEFGVPHPLRLLQVEDSEDDAALILRMLDRAGYEVRHQRVMDEAQMQIAINTATWDLIIADYRLPQFSAPAALSLYYKNHLDIPFIVVSGAVGEDAAVSIMKAGAHDFLLKDKLDRLIPAVDRELAEARVRRRNREADEKLRAVNAELKAIHDNAPLPIFVADENLRVEKMNNQAIEWLQQSDVHDSNAKVCDLLRCSQAGLDCGNSLTRACCHRCPIRTSLESVFATGNAVNSVEWWSSEDRSVEGADRCLLISIAPIVMDQNQRVLITAQDVTQIKSIERSLQASVDSLEAGLAEKTVLVQEIHHRVKNNLQIIASLLSIKARKVKSAESAQDLLDCEWRVKSMAAIHEQLHSQNDMSTVEFAAYIRKIAPDILASFDRESSIALKLDLETTQLSIDQSISCGLILNELITNVIKYAYPNGEGELRISLHTEGDDILLVVSDRGRGIEKGPARSGGSHGMQIVQMLVKKLLGTINIASEDGTTVTLRFPAESFS